MEALIALVICFGGIAGLARLADARGRSVIGWAVTASIAAASLFMVLPTAAHPVNESDLMLILPVLLPALAIAAIAGVLRMLPIKVSSGRTWPINDLTTGHGHHGQLTIGIDHIEISIGNRTHTIPRAALHTVVNDGECVRLTYELDGATHDVILLPRGRPDNPEGHKAQSKALTVRLRGEMPAATVIAASRR